MRRSHSLYSDSHEPSACSHAFARSVSVALSGKVIAFHCIGGLPSLLLLTVP